MKQFKNAIFLFTFALLSFFSTTTRAAVQDQSVAGTNGIVNFQLSYTGLPNFARIFVDADQNKNTGFSVKGVIGAEFLIENDALYRYSGTGQDWNWSFIKNVGFQSTDMTISWLVSGSSIGSVQTFDFVGQIDMPIQTTPKYTLNFGKPKTTPVAGVDTALRDPLAQPFSHTSIWNMPIGSNAVYVPANLPAIPRNDPWAPMPALDEEYLLLDATAPVTSVYYNDAAWTGKDRCIASSKNIVTSIPIPTSYVIPNSRGNNSTAALMADGRTIVQLQPLTRCTSNGIATALLKFPTVDLYGDGISGSHGGSKLSSIGGSLRIGELRPGMSPPKHALKIAIDSNQSLFECKTYTDCFRWPALVADSGAVGTYGSYSHNTNKEMRMGALLVIPASIDLNTVKWETEPGKKLAWTMQNYGAYVVDSTGGAGFDLDSETGPNGSFRKQFQEDWGYDIVQRVRDNTPWMRDVQRIWTMLNVVANNGPASIGGGGVPLQPLAKPLQ